MSKFITKANCGNSPKAEFVKELNKSFFQNNIPAIVGKLTDEVVWEMVGDKVIKGVQSIESHLSKLDGNKMEKFILETVITHGKFASANGEFVIGGNMYKFCDMYEFSSHGKDAKICGVKSYVIKV